MRVKHCKGAGASSRPGGETDELRALAAGVTIAVHACLYFTRGTWWAALREPAGAGGCVATAGRDQETFNVFRAYFRLISGCWMNCPGEHVFLFRHLAVRRVVASFQTCWDLLPSVTCAISPLPHS